MAFSKCKWCGVDQNAGAPHNGCVNDDPTCNPAMRVCFEPKTPTCKTCEELQSGVGNMVSVRADGTPAYFCPTTQDFKAFTDTCPSHKPKPAKPPLGKKPVCASCVNWTRKSIQQGLGICSTGLATVSGTYTHESDTCSNHPDHKPTGAQATATYIDEFAEVGKKTCGTCGRMEPLKGDPMGAVSCKITGKQRTRGYSCVDWCEPGKEFPPACGNCGWVTDEWCYVDATAPVHREDPSYHCSHWKEREETPSPEPNPQPCARCGFETVNNYTLKFDLLDRPLCLHCQRSFEKMWKVEKEYTVGVDVVRGQGRTYGAFYFINPKP